MSSLWDLNDFFFLIFFFFVRIWAGLLRTCSLNCIPYAPIWMLKRHPLNETLDSTLRKSLIYREVKIVDV